MGIYINQPTLDVCFLKPAKFSFDMPGSGIDGGRNGLGESISIEMTGGGHVTAQYQNCFAQRPEEHEYLNWIAARLNGSYRFVNVPIMTGWAGPFPLNSRGIPQPMIRGIPHSDGALFSDGAGYSQASVFGTIETAAALNAGQITINIFGNSRKLRHSDWFSIYNDVKGWRTHRYWEATDPAPVTRTVEGVSVTGEQYTLGITPPLRQAVTAGQRIEFAWPRCVMKFPTGFTMPWEAEGHWQASTSLQFTEAF